MPRLPRILAVFLLLGLLAACRYRLATPDVTLAMPEISIGLFPDVGASWFLNRLPGRIGLFMGLTGARLNITDSIRIGLALPRRTAAIRK